jgi:rubrerythrin
LRAVVSGPSRQVVDRIIEEEKGHIQRLAHMISAT